MLNNFERVLVVAAHPDDEVLGVGGTIKKLTDLGKTVYTLIVTDGSSTQYEGDEKILNDKHRDCKKANNRLGVEEVIIWDFPDMRLDTVPHSELNNQLVDLIEELKIDTVFSQSSGDMNLDHRLIFQSVRVACRPYPGQKVSNLLCYYVNSSTEWGGMSNRETFNPNYFVDISDTIEQKLNAMECYEVELRDYPHPRSLKAIENSAAYFGNMVGKQYAEPFEVIFSISE